jgi:hypothetical protein
MLSKSPMRLSCGERRSSRSLRSAAVGRAACGGAAKGVRMYGGKASDDQGRGRAYADIMGPPGMRDGQWAALPSNTKTAARSGRSERRSACEVCLFAQQNLFAEAVEDVSLVSAVSSSTTRGNTGSGGSPETKTSLSLIALLRVAYESHPAGVLRRLYVPAPSCPKLHSPSKRAAAKDAFSSAQSCKGTTGITASRVLRGLKMILQPLCNARDGCW